jgi:multimeric flavodoxin WrbA
MAKIAVIFYSLYGHSATMAKAAVKGAQAAGAEVKLFQMLVVCIACAIFTADIRIAH